MDKYLLKYKSTVDFGNSSYIHMISHTISVIFKYAFAPHNVDAGISVHCMTCRLLDIIVNVTFSHFPLEIINDRTIFI